MMDLTSWTPVKQFPPRENSRILIFSPVYPESDPMRYRVINSDFLRKCIDATHWTYITEPAEHHDWEKCDDGLCRVCMELSDRRYLMICQECGCKERFCGSLKWHIETEDDLIIICPPCNKEPKDGS